MHEMHNAEAENNFVPNVVDSPFPAKPRMECCTLRIGADFHNDLACINAQRGIMKHVFNS